jgi:hypothetical protein
MLVGTRGVMVEKLPCMDGATCPKRSSASSDRVKAMPYVPALMNIAEGVWPGGDVSDEC